MDDPGVDGLLRLDIDDPDSIEMSIYDKPSCNFKKIFCLTQSSPLEHRNLHQAFSDVFFYLYDYLSNLLSLLELLQYQSLCFEYLADFAVCLFIRKCRSGFKDFVGFYPR